MIKKYVRLISVLIVGIVGIIFTPVSTSDLDDYKKKQIEYNEKKKITKTLFKCVKSIKRIIAI